MRIRIQRRTFLLNAKIVMDADLLDEVGAIGVMWDCMAVAA